MRHSALAHAVVAAAVTGLVAATRRRPVPAATPQRRENDFPALPVQRTSLLGPESDEDLTLAEHEARDNRMFEALDWTSA